MSSSARTGAPVLMPVHDGRRAQVRDRAGERGHRGARDRRHAAAAGAGLRARLHRRRAARPGQQSPAQGADSRPPGRPGPRPTAGRGRAVQVHGLLPDPFPLPVTKKAPKPTRPASPRRWRAGSTKIPSVARMARPASPAPRWSSSPSTASMPTRGAPPPATARTVAIQVGTRSQRLGQVAARAQSARAVDPTARRACGGSCWRVRARRSRSATWSSGEFSSAV